MLNNTHKFLLVLSTSMMTYGAMAQSPGSNQVQQIIEQERSRQISRQISNNVQRRVGGDIDENTQTGLIRKASLQENTLAGSADRNTFMPDTVWDTYSWTRIGNDGGIPTNFDVDVHQNTIAMDKKFGDFYAGLSLTYAYSDLSLDGPTGGELMKGDNHTVQLTPYAAYVINKHLFLSALTGYSYSNDNNRGSFLGSKSETDSYNTELALNALHSIDNWFMTGKIGTRYIHGHSKTTSDFLTGTIRDNADTWIYLTRAEIGYAFANGIRVSNAVLYEYTNPKPNNGSADGVFYYDIGVNYPVSKALNFGVNASTDLSNEDVNISTVALNARLAL